MSNLPFTPSYVYVPYIPLIATRITLFIDFFKNRVGQIWMLTKDLRPFIVVKSRKHVFKESRTYHTVEFLDDGTKKVYKEHAGCILWNKSSNHKRIL